MNSQFYFQESAVAAAQEREKYEVTSFCTAGVICMNSQMLKYTLLSLGIPKEHPD